MLTFVKFFALLLFTIVLSPAAHATPGQPGTLDTTWAASSSLGAGKASTSLTSGSDQAHGIVLQPDGKLLMVGECPDPAASGLRFCALRYNANGTPDASFGSAGIVTTSIASNTIDRARGVALQVDGKIVLAGRCDTGPANNRGTIYDFCAVRYQPNGVLDTTFGTGGKVITKVGVKIFSDQDVAVAVAVQSDGKLVLASSCVYDGFDENNSPFTDTRLCTLRYLTNGTVDTSFGSGGSVLAKLGSRPSETLFAALVVQPDGKLLIASACFFNANINLAGSHQFCVLCYLPDGALDTSFGATNNGKAYARTNYDTYEATAMDIQPDGKLVVAGHCSYITLAMCAVRFNADGTLDVSFGGTTVGSNSAVGTVLTPANTAANSTFDERATAVVVQPDGKLLLMGYCIKETLTAPSIDTYLTTFCGLRYHSDGALDLSYGSAGTGKVSTTMIGGNGDTAKAAVLQPDGKLIVAGFCAAAGGADFCALRYDGGSFANQNCKPDIDGDRLFLATTDALIYSRIARGVTGSALINGITFPATATRKTWPLIRDYLVLQCGMSLVP